MATDVTVPPLGESVLEATVGHWLKREGEPVAVGEVLVELETEKVNAEVAADRAGVLEHILHAEGEIVRPGDSLAVLAEGPVAARTELQGPSPAPTAPAEKATEVEAKPEAAVRASPIAERMAAELNVDLAHVPATGPGGRVTKQDVESFVSEQAKAGAVAEEGQVTAAPFAPPPATAPPPPIAAGEVSAPSPAAEGTRAETRQRLSRRRLTIARRLVEAQHAAAMLTTFNEVDMSAVMALRQKQRQPFKERYGVDLGYMSFFIKASIAALKLFPEVNAELQGDDLVIKHYFDIGVAIGDPEGLVVPVLRDAQLMTFADIEQTIAEFVRKSRERALTLGDLRGGTFTITNGGVYGSLMSTPILNPPQVGILGVHKIESRPVALDGQVVIRPMMYVALSYDHRVVDGREAVQFLVKVKEFIEQPELLLFET
jgi:2-oxoglutarate dehydrogenase E2 component (dihydrolipoamide succinyltransferase)